MVVSRNRYRCRPDRLPRFVLRWAYRMVCLMSECLPQIKRGNLRSSNESIGHQHQLRATGGMIGQVIRIGIRQVAHRLSLTRLGIDRVELCAG